MPAIFDAALELHLAPATAGLRLAQSRDQPAGLATEPLLCFDDRAEVLLHRAVRLPATIAKRDAALASAGQYQARVSELEA